MTPEMIVACTGASLARSTELAVPLTAAMVEFDINTPKRQAAFLAQIAHESGSLRYMREIWGPTDAQKRYEPPSDLARRLGNTEPGDGRRFSGRGLIQVTGRFNYAKYGKMLGLDLVSHPELLDDPTNACRSAGAYWAVNGCNTLADVDAFETITRRINGGLNGLDDRKQRWATAKLALNVT